MKHIQTEILVIGGGATGTGILRDLSMRGFRAVLVEKRDLAHGTTGRYHGLLHSGGRYVVKDPQAAHECIEENRILRKIMPQCIEDTGGFYVQTPWDDPNYAPRFITGCGEAGIPVEEIPISQMLREEPLLNPEITRCFRVPDASADSFLAAEANVASAIEYGGKALMYHEVIRLVTNPNPKGGSPRQVTGALCHDLEHDEPVMIDADIVVNASGAWAGKIAATAGIVVHIRPGKGTMLAFNHRMINTVVSRCKMPADGDIIVPIHTVAVIGTTDEQVTDPDHFGIEPWEIDLMLTEGEKLVPGLKDFRVLRAWAGVRPLYQESQVKASRSITRAYVLLDHAERDDMEGMVTITSGKWTTYRKMAEVTVDKICEKLGVKRPCRTHLEILPFDEIERGKSTSYHSSEVRLAQVESGKEFRNLVCECELATYSDIRRAILQGNARTIDDIRRDTRLGMGPCQGGFCTFRVAGILHELRKPPVEQSNAALLDFLQERWKGLRPILWGQQLRQERLDELVYRDTLNVTTLPGPSSSTLGPEDYKPGASSSPGRFLPSDVKKTPSRINSEVSDEGVTKTSSSPASVDVLIIGAGLAGLTAGWRAALRGKRVRVISKGWGSLFWGSGCIDVLGYSVGGGKKPVISLLDGLTNLTQDYPNHPYAKAGLDNLDEALETLRKLSGQMGNPLAGSLAKNWLLPSALGAFRPTCLAPESMVAGDVSLPDPMLIVGFNRYQDFFPTLLADNLEAQGIPAQGIVLDVPYLRERHNLTSRNLALCFENQEFRGEVTQAIRSHLVRSRRLVPGLRIGFPAVLGWSNPELVWQDLQDQLGCSVFEIAGLPPSIPGMRLHQALIAAIEQAGGTVLEGMAVTGMESTKGTVEVVWSEAAARRKPHRARQYVLATGGLLGGGIVADPDGFLDERIFQLPLEAPLNPSEWFIPKFLAAEGHPVFRSGIPTDNLFQPVDAAGNTVFTNLSIVGQGIAGPDPILEHSLEGIALCTGYLVGERLASL